jgi:hydrogenase nickel incorporation protein HypA/HybF
MHEWALAEAVLDSLQQHIETYPGHAVTAVRVSVGELQQVDVEVFREGLRQLADRYPLDPNVVHVAVNPARFRCNRCGQAWDLSAAGPLSEDEEESIHFVPEAVHVYSRCPACNSVDFQVLQGRGVTIDAIDLEERASS